MSSRSSYPIPAYPQQSELIIKRSRFITTVNYADSHDQAKTLIADIRAQYPDARHHCWAFILGAPTDLQGVDQSDDGEPKDTAGKPILNVLQHSGLGHTLIVVSRYFGGVKLGAGGLVRAYSQSASQALQTLQTQQHTICAEAEITLPYYLLGKVEYWLALKTINISDKQFDDNVRLLIDIPVGTIDDFEQELALLGNGDVRLITSE